MSDLPKQDTAWSAFRWALACKALDLCLRLAPEGDAKRYLASCVSEWARECKRQWAMRYPDRPTVPKAGGVDG